MDVTSKGFPIPSKIASNISSSCIQFEKTSQDNVIQQIQLIDFSNGISVDGKNNKIVGVTDKPSILRYWELIGWRGEGIEVRDVKCEDANSPYNVRTSEKSGKFINVWGRVEVWGSNSLFENLHSKEKISAKWTAKNILLKNCSSPELWGKKYSTVNNVIFLK